MKFVWYSLAAILVAFIVIQFMSFRSSNSVEQYSYKVLKKIDQVEIREYESALFTKTSLNTSNYSESSSSGFRILAGYIFGDNSDSSKIAMTSPVVMSIDQKSEMMFMVPKNLKKEELPTPNNSSIEFIELPNRKLAAITFDGYADDSKIQTHKALLDSTLKANNIEHKGNFSFFGYNPPYQMFDRRNEVVVEVK